MTGGTITNPRFVFLGTGTSGGVPIIACSCATCTSDDPRDKRTRTGATITWTDPAGNPRVALIDCTPDLRQQALREGLTRCDAILFTHNHVDHIFGLDEVRRFNAVMRTPIDIYAEPHTLGALRRVYQHIFDKEANINDSFVASLIAHEIAPPPHGPAIDLYGLRFTPIRLLHGRLAIVGFRVEPVPGVEVDGGGPFPLAYCTDVSKIPPETWRSLEGLDTLVLDGLRIRRHPTHFNVDRAISVALRVGARRTFLTHIAHEIQHARIDAELPEPIRLAYDGLALNAPAPQTVPDAPDEGRAEGPGPAAAADRPGAGGRGGRPLHS